MLIASSACSRHLSRGCSPCLSIVPPVKGYVPSRLLDRRCGAVLLVADVLAPLDGAAVLAGRVDGDVRHQARCRSPVPVLLAGLEQDAVARTDHLDRPALALAEADALG